MLWALLMILVGTRYFKLLSDFFRLCKQDQLAINNHLAHKISKKNIYMSIIIVHKKENLDKFLNWKITRIYGFIMKPEPYRPIQLYAYGE